MCQELDRGGDRAMPSPPLERRGGSPWLALAALAALGGVAAGGAADAQTNTGAPQSAPVEQVDNQRMLIFAGGQIDFANAGYVGAMVPLPGASIGHGFGIRGSVSGGDYDYHSTPGQVHGDFYGGQLEGVYQFSRPGFWLDLAAGARYDDTHLSPFDRSNRRHGSQVEAEVSADGGAVGGPWRTDYYGSYGTRLDDYAARVSLTHRINAIFRAGAEVSAEGDPTYDLQRIGPYVGYAFSVHSELQLSVGVSHQSGEGEGGYLRVLYYHSF